MYQYQHQILDDGQIKILGLPYESKLVEIPRMDRFRQLYSYKLSEIDINRVREYLNIARNTEDKIIKDGLFKSAVVTYMKCFAPSKGRSIIDAKGIYKNIPGAMDCHKAFKEMRNKYFAHDEMDYKEAQIGIILNVEEKRKAGIVSIDKCSEFVYADNIEILDKLCSIALEQVKALVERELKKADKFYDDIDYEIMNGYPEMQVNTEAEEFKIENPK